VVEEEEGDFFDDDEFDEYAFVQSPVKQRVESNENEESKYAE
jgi:hypothetical protein